MSRLSTCSASFLVLLLAGPALGQGSFPPIIPDPGHPILSRTFQADTDQQSRKVLTGGSMFQMLENGVNSFPRKLDLVRTAQRSVFVTTMIAAWDTTGRQMAQELIAAAGRGVEVRCLFDGQRTDPRITRALQRGGVRVELYNPFFDWGGRKQRLHMKMVVRDLRTAIVGGMNMSDSYNLGDGQNDNYKDTDVLAEGDAAAQIAQSFLELWTSLHPRDTWAADELARLPQWGPLPATADQVGCSRFLVQESDLGLYAIRDYYKRCFDVARSRIAWHVNNLIPTGPVWESVRDAAARGVRVVLVTNSLRANVRRYGWMGYFQYAFVWVMRQRLRGTTVELWEIDVPIHSKAMTVDGVMASIGSYNFSNSADKYLEASLTIYDPNLVAEVEAMFARDLQGARRVR